MRRLHTMGQVLGRGGRLGTATAVILLATVVTACAATPRERYIAALDQRLEGNASAYRDQLIDLAQDAPDSRAGRRAQAILGPGSLLGTLSWLGLAASLGGAGFSPGSFVGGDDEVRKTLGQLHELQQQHWMSTGRYCELFLECEFAATGELRYLYLLSMRESVGATGGVEADLFMLQVDAQLGGMGLRPGVSESGYLIFAVRNQDNDPELDVWSIDEEGTLVHLLDD